MSIYLNKNWWQNCFQATKCLILRWEIWLIVYEESDEIATNKIDRLVEREKYRYPGKSELWYLEKIIYDLRKRISI